MKIKTIQIFFLVFFIVFAIIGFIMFATYTSTKVGEEEVGKVEIWGQVDKRVMDLLLQKLMKSDRNYNKVTYKEIKSNNYQQYLMDKFASGEYPDLFIVSQDDLFFITNKVYVVPYSAFSIRNFNDTFVDTFSIFKGDKGIYAIPFIINPMIMFYNKDILETASISLPPKTWDDFIDFTKKITKKDENDNIRQSAISFGIVSNIDHFKEIILSLFFQLGNPIVVKHNDKFSTIQKFDKSNNPLQAIRFFMEFSDPTSVLYTWNKSLPHSRDYFLAGNLATYFGFISEIYEIQKINPNLNFDTAELPQVKNINRKSTYARIYALSTPKNAKNIKGALLVAKALSSKEMQKVLSEQIKLPPVRRDLLKEPVADPLLEIGYTESVYAKTFIDPDYNVTNDIFRFMIDAIYGGKYSPTQSIYNAMKEINLLFKKKK